jgi:hypothetical protein
MIEPVPLSQEFTHAIPEAGEAYAICLAAQDRICQSSPTEHGTAGEFGMEQTAKDLIYIRILGHLISVAPTPSALLYISSEIRDTHGDYSEVVKLGRFYFKYFIRSCNNLTLRT